MLDLTICLQNSTCRKPHAEQKYVDKRPRLRQRVTEDLFAAVTVQIITVCLH